MSFDGIQHWLWSLHHDNEEYEGWGSLYEVAFWVIVLLVHVGLVIYAAWSLAVKHTEATGSSVLVPVKADEVSSSPSGDSNLLGGTTRRKTRGGFSSFLRSS